MAAWATTNLDSVAEMATDKTSVSKLTAEHYISTENMLPDRGGVELAAKLPSSGSVNAFLPGDILFSNIRTYFKKVWLAPWQGGASADVIVFRPRGARKIESQYLYYVLSSDTFIESTVTASKGTKMPRGDKEAMRRFEFALPPLSIQRRIAGILSAYDELIENSQRRIKILESLARALYREWFVHFCFPGHESVPRVQSPMGEIPKGWLLPLTDHVDFKEGPGLRNWQYRDEGIPFLNIRTLVDNDIDFSKVQFLDPQEVESKYQHFLLSEYDHVVSSSGTIGRIVTIRAEHLPLMLNTSIIRMRPKGDRMGCWLLKHYMLSDYFQNQAKSFAIGAAQANFGPIHLKQMHIIAPPAAMAAEYERLTAPIELQILASARQIQNLRRTRDLLLPRLLSGEVALEA